MGKWGQCFFLHCENRRLPTQRGEVGRLGPQDRVGGGVLAIPVPSSAGTNREPSLASTRKFITLILPTPDERKRRGELRNRGSPGFSEGCLGWRWWAWGCGGNGVHLGDLPTQASHSHSFKAAIIKKANK